MKNTLNILMTSDWHGRLPKLPVAIAESRIDILICCGDLEPNFSKNWSYNDYFQRMVNKNAEAIDQLAWIQNEFMSWVKKHDIGEIVYVPGNHTFCDPTSVLKNTVYTEPKTIELYGIKIALLPGSMKLAGEWQLEISEDEMQQKIEQLDKDIEILVSHCPPRSILDTAFSGDRIGTQAITGAIFGRMGSRPYFTKLTHHAFGHCHETKSSVELEVIPEGDEISDPRRVWFHNVAQTYKAIEFTKIL